MACRNVCQMFTFLAEDAFIMRHTNTLSLVHCLCSLQRGKLWRRGEKERVTSFKHFSPTGGKTSWTHQPFTLRPASPPLQPSLWWEHWQRLVDNWKLQSTESNYPEQDFPNILRSGVALFASSMRPRLRNILFTHFASLCPLSCLLWWL